MVEINIQQIGKIVSELLSVQTREKLERIFSHGEKMYDEATAAAEIGAALVYELFFTDEVEEGAAAEMDRELEPQTEFDELVAEGLQKYNR